MTPTAMARAVPVLPHFTEFPAAPSPTLHPTQRAAAIASLAGPGRMDQLAGGAQTAGAACCLGSIYDRGNGGVSAHSAGGETPASLPVVPVPPSGLLMLTVLAAGMLAARRRGCRA